MMARTKPLMLRGTLYTFRRKCGNPNCRCRRGEPHESPALSYSVKGRTRLITLSAGDVPRVEKALERYREASRALEDRAIEDAMRLKAELAERRTSGGGGK
jgi:hypothetical protein